MVNPSSAVESSYADVSTHFKRWSADKSIEFGKDLCTGEKFYILDKTLDWMGMLKLQGLEYVPGVNNLPNMPEGYYTIENVFIVEESFDNYRFRVKLPKELVWRMPSKDEFLKECENWTPPFSLPSDVIYEVVSDDTKDRYYLRDLIGALPVKSYEHVQNDLVGNDVRLLVRNVEINRVNKNVRDELSYSYVPITTSLFHCVDIAVAKEMPNGYGATQVAVILEHNGSRFALKLNKAQSYEFGMIYMTKDGIQLLTDDTYKKMLLNEEEIRRDYEESVRKATEEKKQLLLAKYGVIYGQQVADRNVSIGMSEEMVLDAWGFPETRFNHTNAFGRVSVWSYGITNYVSFSDGKVVAITQGDY